MRNWREGKEIMHSPSLLAPLVMKILARLARKDQFMINVHVGDKCVLSCLLCDTPDAIASITTNAMKSKML